MQTQSNPLWKAIVLVSAVFVLEACAATQPARNVMSGDVTGCSLAPAPRDAQIVLAALREGQAISSAAVGGFDDETTLVNVDIEPGERPLYVVLASQSAMIWRFRGATDRVVAAALVTHRGDARERPAVGAVGVAREKVQIFHASVCFPSFDNAAPLRRRTAPADGPADAGGRSRCRPIALAPARPPSPDVVEVIELPSPGPLAPAPCSGPEVIEEMLGRPPDIVAGAYEATTLALPSGRFGETEHSPPPPEGFHPETWKEAVRFWPAGLVRVDPREVVGARAQTYDVLPGQVGLAQLVGDGRLEYMGGLETRAEGDYRIVRPIPRYPAGLHGAHLVRFLIEEGVPEPAGDPGHSCVVNKTTGAINDMCRLRN